MKLLLWVALGELASLNVGVPQQPDSLGLPGFVLEAAALVSSADSVVAVRWPAIWSRHQSFGFYLADGPRIGIVGQRPSSPHYRQIPDSLLPAILHGKVFVAVFSGVEDQDLGITSPLAYIPYVYVRDTVPVAGQTGTVEELVRSVYERSFLANGRGFFGGEAKPLFTSGRIPLSCPSAVPQSCSEALRLERSLLREAASGSSRSNRALGDFLALHWLRLANLYHPNNEVFAETRAGVIGRLTSEAAEYALGKHWRSYERQLLQRYSVQRRAGGPWSLHRLDGSLTPEAGTSGELMLLVLDRRQVDWMTAVRQGTSLFALLLSSRPAAERMALVPRGVAVLGRIGLGARVASVDYKKPGLEHETFFRMTHFAAGLQHLAGTNEALAIQLPTGMFADSTRVRMRIEPGSAGQTYVGNRGDALIPDPTSLELKAPGITLRVTGHPVAVFHRPGNATGLVRVLVFIPDSLLSSLLPLANSSTRSHAMTISAPGIHLELEAGLQVGHWFGFVAITPDEP